MRETVRVVGKAIKRAAEYLPIRNHAAALATLAPPKDYLRQLRAVYDDFLSRWRYVKDPVHRELVTHSPEAVWRYLLAGDGVGVGLGRGAGDCDCASVAIGSELFSIGFPVRLGTTSAPNAPPGNLFQHIFVQALVPKVGWVTVDPVLHPNRPFGATAPHSRFAAWNLDGNLLGYIGNISGGLGGNEMYGFYGFGDDEEDDYSGMMGFASYEDAGEPEEWETVGLADWGAYSPMMGIMSAETLPPLHAEVQTDMNGLARTPMIELSPSDYKYVAARRQPYPGMMGLGDDGQVYVYQESPGMLGGFFKRMFRKIRRGVRKVARKIGRGLKKVIRKLPGGKFLLKIASKIHKVAMKIVRPLMKFVGKYASKLAPIAALIPGYGPAIAAGLHMAGKVAKLMTKHGVRFAGKKGKVRTLVADNPGNIKDMQRDLAEAAAKQKSAKKMKVRGGYTDRPEPVPLPRPRPRPRRRRALSPPSPRRRGHIRTARAAYPPPMRGQAPMYYR